MAKKNEAGKQPKKAKSVKKPNLTGKEKRVKDITTMLETIRRDWLELSKTIDDVHKTKALKKHLEWCEEELSELQRKAEK